MCSPQNVWTGDSPLNVIGKKNSPAHICCDNCQQIISVKRQCLLSSSHARVLQSFFLFLHPAVYSRWYQQNVNESCTDIEKGRKIGWEALKPTQLLTSECRRARQSAIHKPLAVAERKQVIALQHKRSVSTVARNLPLCIVARAVPFTQEQHCRWSPVFELHWLLFFLQQISWLAVLKCVSFCPCKLI